MTTSTDQFVQLTQRGQEAFGAVVRAWQDAARSYTDAFTFPDTRLPDVQVTVDAAFDLAARVLADQRELAKALVAVGARSVETFAEQATQAAEGVVTAAQHAAREVAPDAEASKRDRTPRATD